MKRLPPIVALLVAGCVFLAAAAPCPPSETLDLHPAHAAPAPEDEPAAHHDAHDGMAHRGEARAAKPPCHAEEPPRLLLTRPCACGCQQESAPRTASSRLGFALAHAALPVAGPASPLFPPAAAPQAPAFPPLGRDPIPI